MLVPSATGRLWRPGSSAAFTPVVALVASLLLGALPVQAHHFIEITQLSPTVWNGLLSGLVHPVLGPDHLLFLMALSLLGLRQRRRWTLALLALALLGSAAGLLLPGLPGMDFILAGTLGLEALVLLGWLPSAVVLPAMALHGYVLSASVLGWNSTPIASYLLGLLISQGLLVMASLALLRPMANRLLRTGTQRRWLALALFGSAVALALVAERS